MSERCASKAEVLSALRLMFGPTTRIQRIHRAGVVGHQVLSRGRLLLQTFEAEGNWRVLVRGCMPLWMERTRRLARRTWGPEQESQLTARIAQAVVPSWAREATP